MDVVAEKIGGSLQNQFQIKQLQKHINDYQEQIGKIQQVMGQAGQKRKYYIITINV